MARYGYPPLLPDERCPSTGDHPAGRRSRSATWVTLRAGNGTKTGGKNHPQQPRDLVPLRCEVCEACILRALQAARNIRISPRPIPRSPGRIPVTGTSSLTHSPTKLRDATLQTAAYNSQRNTRSKSAYFT